MTLRTSTLAGCMAAALAGCTLALDWDPADLPCLNGECANGYSCLVNKCVENGSLGVGDTCNKNDQCDPALVCAPNLFTCRQPCATDSFYKSQSDCPSGEYCAPVLLEDNDPSYAYMGVCVDSDDCTSDSDCDSGACVKISTTAFACLEHCQVSWGGTGTEYTDTCAGPPTLPRYCQPIGAPTQERLVCLDTRAGAEIEGGLCEPVTRPCEKGLACINGTCRRHCNSSPGSGICNAGEACCARLDGLESYGICAADCGTL